MSFTIKNILQIYRYRVMAYSEKKKILKFRKEKKKQIDDLIFDIQKSRV